jgi:hypothetical protein
MFITLMEEASVIRLASGDEISVPEVLPEMEPALFENGVEIIRLGDNFLMIFSEAPVVDAVCSYYETETGEEKFVQFIESDDSSTSPVDKKDPGFIIPVLSAALGYFVGSKTHD